ncbi:MAG TPA: amidase domain-containing protein [Archangium sp.]|uniref:amidase domain-containing protein n=1 Tax=Archangium sp. TaxID=1872627 RepID=UPI002E3292C5|nr:amidase domain-containing protein [Archangium sp.]HEX5752967.1 amidase domain-containing protein [Archangium sp.]
MKTFSTLGCTAALTALLAGCGGEPDAGQAQAGDANTGTLHLDLQGRFEGALALELSACGDAEGAQEVRIDLTGKDSVRLPAAHYCTPSIIRKDGERSTFSNQTMTVVAGKSITLHVNDEYIHAVNDTEEDVPSPLLQGVVGSDVVYDGGRAAWYARTYVNTPYGTTVGTNRFPNYSSSTGGTGGGNCTNFISQSMLAGFLGRLYARNSDIDFTWNNKAAFWDEWGLNPDMWYFKYDGVPYAARTTTWAGVTDLMTYAQNAIASSTSAGIEFTRLPNGTREFTWSDAIVNEVNFQLGDLVVANLYGDGYNHFMMVTRIDTAALGDNKVLLTYQTVNTFEKSLETVQIEFKEAVRFRVYRPNIFNVP